MRLHTHVMRNSPPAPVTARTANHTMQGVPRHPSRMGKQEITTPVQLKGCLTLAL